MFLTVLLTQFAALAAACEVLVRLAGACDDVRPCEPLLVALALLVLIKVVIVTAGGLRHLRLTRRLHKGVGVSKAHHQALTEIVRRLGLEGRVTFIDDYQMVAFTTGVFRSRVVISSGLVDRLDSRQLEAVLRHEKCHVDAADPLLYLLITITSQMFFYLPAVGRFLNRLTARRELAADACAVRACGVGPLAGALLATLKASPGTVPRAKHETLPALVRSGNLLERRLEQMETGRAPRPDRLPLRCLAATAPGALGLAMAGFFILRMCIVCFTCSDC